MLSSDTFSPDAIAPATITANQTRIAGMAAAGWVFPPSSVDALRNMPGPVPYYSPRAETLLVATPAREVPVRVIPSLAPVGVYFFCHSGGWTIGRADRHDPALERIVDRTGLTALSIDYRLAPEHPYPAGLDDCEHAFRWILAHASERFGGDRVVIGGSSAGANLALCTLLRVRGCSGWEHVRGANLLYGNYDLTMTPSQRTATPDSHLISTDSLSWFYDQYVPDHVRRHDPDVSPLYADLRGLPPTLLSVGSHDSLLDDTVFLACRMLAAGVKCDLQVVPGGEHAFDMLAVASSFDAIERSEAYIAALVQDGVADPLP